MPTTSIDTQQHAAHVLEILEHSYGRRTVGYGGDPVGELIGTILSQSTTDHNSGIAYRRLRAHFADWNAVLAADEDDLEATIRCAGLGRIKARRIQAALGTIVARVGSLDLSLLNTMDLDAAERWLTALPGVGPKTAACVLMFALGRPALPVDTHVHRVAGRLGLIGPRVSADAAHRLLRDLVPAADIVSFHMTMIAHGKAICAAQRPRCPGCPLAAICPYAQARP